MKKSLHGNKAAPDRLRKGFRFATAIAMACFLAFAPAAPAFALAGADADDGETASAVDDASPVEGDDVANNVAVTPASDSASSAAA